MLKGRRPALGIETKRFDPAAIEHNKAFDAYVRHGEASGLKRLEEKALSVGSGADGGYLVPEETEREIGRRLSQVSPIRSFYEETFNRGNVAFAARVHGAGYRYHDITVAGGPVDHATYMARNAGFAAAFPDRKVEIEDLIAAGDRVVARALLHATHLGPLGDIAPTGRKVRLASTIIYRFERGQVAEEWEIFDKLGMYRQLGVAPPAS